MDHSLPETLGDRIRDLYEEASERVANLRTQLEDAESAADGLRSTLLGMGVDVGVGHHELSGTALRQEILTILRESDPERRGVHYQDVAARISERGHTISGRNKAGNVNAHMSRSPLFEGLGRGLYTWQTDAVGPSGEDASEPLHEEDGEAPSIDSDT